VLGINRGKLGFLTDIPPDELEQVGQVIEGNYLEESRLLLTAQLDNNHEYALNDVVLHSGNIAHMIEFDILVNGQFMCSQRADGFIIATPTGSTAYALSTDGPLLHPTLNALLLVAICPHTLSSRPMVVTSDSVITIVVNKDNANSALLSCDGQEPKRILPGGHLTVSKKPTMLRLIHPLSYSYFETLRQKLHWEGRRC
jgi:NAD+ kinase